MFTNISMAGSGMIVLAITVALRLFGIVPQDGQIDMVVQAGGQVLGWVLIIWGQVRRKDLVAGLLRR